MKHQFTLPIFPGSAFEIEFSLWKGITKLFKDGESISRAKEKGKPFLIPDHSGEIMKAYIKPKYMDIIPAFQIDGIQYDLAEQLRWYEYAICLAPLILMILGGGGGLGGALGGLASGLSVQTMRSKSTAGVKYLKVIGITVLTFALYLFVTRIILVWLNK